MIKKSVFETDLILGMQQELIKNASTHDASNVEQAVDYLNSAIDIFEDVGMHTQANKILNILTKIAQDASQLPLNKLLEHGVQPDDIKEISVNPASKARINIALRNLGYSDQEIIALIGQHNLMTPEECQMLVRNYSLKSAQDMNDTKKHRNPGKISDRHTKGLNPDKMTKNLLDHGTVFNMADDGFDLLNADISDDLTVEEDIDDQTFEDED